MKPNAFAAIMLISLVWGGAVAVAEDDDLDIHVCAAEFASVFPCDLEGNVLEEFAQGDCAAEFQAQCSGISPQSLGERSAARRFAQCKTNYRALRRDRDRAIRKRDKKISELRNMITSLNQRLEASR